tara:strand:- start:98 stop:337 length:240 start_codon:yes stop_codon:yes gene_type:complete
MNESSSVEIMLNNANISKNNFLLENLSDNKPNKGAIKISTRLADELDIPRYSVLSFGDIDDAKYSANIIGKKPARTIVA